MESYEFLIKFSEYVNSEYVKFYKSKYDFAIACNVDEKTIRRVLKAEQNISFKILINICSALNTKPSIVFGIVENL
ncbi:MAG: hypothetical protein HYU67_11055 [Flavobacteriia bacterium]|nr:hypothetical protein [Flavobacteriia bacterium]